MKIILDTGDSSKEVDIYSEEGLQLISQLWTKVSFHNRVVYEPTWLGIPIIQEPADIVMMQELIWQEKPDVIIETGVAHGGSAILYASVLELLGKGEVVGVDVEIREHNRKAIIEHPLSKRIQLIEGNSIDPVIVKKVEDFVKDKPKVLVILDSNHSYEHVFQELQLYSKFVSLGSYMVTMDGIQKMLADNPTGKSEWKYDNPLRAIQDFLKDNSQWKVDPHYNRLHITYTPQGFLKKVHQ